MIYSGRRTTLITSAPSTTWHSCSIPRQVPEMMMNFPGGNGRGRWWGALLCSSVIDVVALWLTRSLVCETTVLSRMFSSFLHFPNSLIHTFWFICLFFSYHRFPFSISHPARWHIITHLSWDKKFFKIPQESS